MPTASAMEVCYSSLSVEELESRIQAYESKYGMRFSNYARSFSLGSADVDKRADYLDWKCLLLELADRLLSEDARSYNDSNETQGSGDNRRLAAMPEGRPQV
jgi:hypothetical protein